MNFSKNQGKTKRELMYELNELRQQLSGLNALQAEHRIMQTRLKDIEDKYYTLANSIPHIVMNCDREGDIQFISHTASSLVTGGTVRASSFDYIAPDYHDRYRQALERTFETGESDRFEYSTPAAYSKWWGAYVVPVKSDGQVTTALVILTDVTEQKEIEEALQRSKERLRVMINDVPDTIYSCLPDGRASMIFISARYEDWTGYSPQDFYQDPETWPRSIHPEDRARAIKEFIEAIEQEKEYDCEYRIAHKDTGLIHYVRDHGAPIKDEKGNVIRFDGIIINITEHKKMEQALEDSERFSSSILNNSTNAMLVINPDTSIRYVNPAFERLTGFHRSEIIDRKPPYPWSTEETKVKTSSDIQMTMRKGMGGLEEVYQMRNGRRFLVEITGVPLRSSGELKNYLLSWVDVTARERLKENMQLYIAEITRAQEAERKRIACALHDETIQALFIMITDIDEIITGKERLSVGNTRQLRHLQVAINHMMDEMRRFCHALRPGLLDQLGLIPSLELLTEEMDRGGKLNCHLEVIGRQRRLTSEVELALFRITQEALRNIRKYSEAAEAIIEIKFTNRKVTLNIADDGCGFKLDRTLGNYARSGKLGLMGMRERARLVNGSFSIKSEVNKGARITAVIPTYSS